MNRKLFTIAEFVPSASGFISIDNLNRAGQINVDPVYVKKLISIKSKIVFPNEIKNIVEVREKPIVSMIRGFIFFNKKPVIGDKQIDIIPFIVRIKLT